MYLMDQLNLWATRFGIDAIKNPPLRGYTELAAKLIGCPRYILDAKATRTVVELNLGRPKIMREAMQHCAVPYPRLWVEWDDADRQRLRDRFNEPLAYAELRPMPGRVGFLVEADPTGRRGRVIWAWTTPGSEIPNVGAIEARFDLDVVHPLDQDRVIGLQRGNLVRLWEGNPVQIEALFDIWRTAVHVTVHWAGSMWSQL